MRSGEMTRHSSKSADLRRAFYVKRAANPRDETTIIYGICGTCPPYTREIPVPKKTIP